MAGELYAMSSSLVEYIATTPSLRGQVRGKEDKLTARWIRQHPRANEVRWRSERCWMYDHPRAGTVYSHGFLFPSEVEKVRHEISQDLTPAGLHLLPHATGSSVSVSVSGATAADPSLTHSTVSRYGVRYTPPAPNLSAEQEVEALVEGSALSRLRDESVGGPNGEATDREVESAWRRRESRWMRTIGALGENSRNGVEGAVGGTVLVHFIKRNEWFLETALAFLEDEPAPPALEEGLPYLDKDPSPPVGSGGNRVETDLSGKNPPDLSHLDPEPEPVPDKSSSSPWRIETDFGNKTPIDFSHLEGEEESTVESGIVEIPEEDLEVEHSDVATPVEEEVSKEGEAEVVPVVEENIPETVDDVVVPESEPEVHDTPEDVPEPVEAESPPAIHVVEDPEPVDSEPQEDTIEKVSPVIIAETAVAVDKSGPSDTPLFAEASYSPPSES